MGNATAITYQYVAKLTFSSISNIPAVSCSDELSANEWLEQEMDDRSSMPCLDDLAVAFATGSESLGPTLTFLQLAVKRLSRTVLFFGEDCSLSERREESRTPLCMVQ